MAGSSQHSYSPLDGGEAIRLLAIDVVDAKIQGQIKCRLVHFNLKKVPPYAALSYAWGDGTHKSQIQLDGQICEVTQNLWQALWHLRSLHICVSWNQAPPTSPSGKPMWIWIDALCIDQQNILERNHQVRLMGCIYKTAIRVIVWLGWNGTESDRKSQVAMHYLTQIGKDVSAHILSDGIRLDETKSLAIHRGLQTLHLDERDAMRITKKLYTSDLSKFVELFKLPYWKRMWIVQEIGMARNITILLGRRIVEWDSVRLLGKFLDYKEFTNSLPITKQQSYSWNCEKIRTSQAFRLADLRTGKRTKNLAALIEACQDSLCSDPRDKIYALLGLATDSRKDELAVDYSKTLFEVYVDTVIFQYRISNCHQGDPSREIVRFSQIIQRSFDRVSELRDSTDSYNSDKCEAQYHRDLLHVFGVCAGIIKDLSNPASSTATLVGKARVLPQFNSPKPPEASLEVLEVMKKVTSISTNTSFALNTRNATDQSIATNIANTSPTQQPSLSFNKREDGRYLTFKLDNQRTGFAPTNAQSGDIICQFLGCDIAALLRPRPGGYDIIGRAFLKKSATEILTYDDASAKKYLFSVPEFGANLNWTSEQAMHLCIDIITLQRLTS